MKKNVKNVPTYANDYPYWVVNLIDDEMWFYGAWADQEKAECVAREMQCLRDNPVLVLSD